MPATVVVDHRGRLRQNDLDRLCALSDEDLYTQTRNILWLLTHAAPGSRKENEFQKELCVRAWQERDGISNYYQAYREVAAV